MPNSNHIAPIVLTGGSGFVGEHVVKALLEANVKQDEIFNWSRSFESLHAERQVRCEVVDITDADKITELVKATQPRAILHLAGISEPLKVKVDFNLGWKVNVDGLCNVALAVKEHSPHTRLVFAGSSEVYGESFNEVDAPITEQARLRPRTPYGVTKACADILLDQMTQEGLDVIRIRAFNHTGPNQRPDFVVPAFAQQIAWIEAGLREPILNVGNLLSCRDFLDVRDVARAYCACLLNDIRDVKERVFNLCSGKSISMQQLLNQLLELSDADISIQVDPSRLRISEVPIAIGDNSKFCETFSWRPEIDFRTTLLDCLSHYRQLALAARN